MNSNLNVQVNGTGPPVLFVNGPYNHADAWLPYIEALQPNHSVIRFDFPPRTEETPEAAFTDQCNHILRALEISGHAPQETTAVGVSAGANLLRYAHLSGEGIAFRGLMLIGPNPGGISEFLRQLHASYLVVLEKHGLEAFWRSCLLTFYSPIFFNDHPGIFDFLVQKLCETFAGEERRIAQMVRDVLGDPTLAEPPTQFRSPVLIIRGQDDALIPAARMEAYVRRCEGPSFEYRMLSGGHSVPFENPVEVGTVLASFIARLPSAPSR